MLKVTEDGIVGMGEVIELTEDDRKTIVEMFLGYSLPVVEKKNGVWKLKEDYSKEMS